MAAQSGIDAIKAGKDRASIDYRCCRKPNVGMNMLSGGGLIPLFAELRPALSRFLQTRGASPDEAEDILQDVNIKLLADVSGPVAQPRAYLYKMTNNHFLLHRRTAGRRERREEDWVSAHGGDGEADDQPSVETELIAREQLAILQRVLDGLPERTRVIFRRFRIDGEPQRAVAEELGISVSAVEKHLARAYEAISVAKLRLDEDHSSRRSLTGERGRHAI
ncbi:sigma-70 family RNA polymerase sigma factor [Sphingomonas gei]|uniref:Sigma-70 family RNA polymerase sigma factor n=1 Tax=Sphingomonas gei TaxID=1395960 RepID=A0A4S1XIW0_9SPHN|nr:sigma-70 family RNA polymerase sigma factor [Sphingomonas gei]TGX55753.1 sigma-70 family RNA polymerase sigma factor [Sphingomonas gei]